MSQRLMRFRLYWALGAAAATMLALTAGRVSEAEQAPEVVSAPKDLTPLAIICGEDEPGERLVITGHVYAPDGKTPVAGVIVYGYHTDATGHYRKDGANRPARLHGWAKTDPDGRFEFRTIRPAAYPGRNIPAHVHFIVWGAGYPRQWVDELRFENDPFVTPRMLAESAQAGDFGTVRALKRGPDGALYCTVNYRLQRTTNFKE